jgi:ankyrin repeat protein
MSITFYKGRTALMKAAELGHVQALEILKKSKADATLRDLEGKGDRLIMGIY